MSPKGRPVRRRRAQAHRLQGTEPVQTPAMAPLRGRAAMTRRVVLLAAAMALVLCPLPVMADDRTAGSAEWRSRGGTGADRGRADRRGARCGRAAPSRPGYPRSGFHPGFLLSRRPLRFPAFRHPLRSGQEHVRSARPGAAAHLRCGARGLPGISSAAPSMRRSTPRAFPGCRGSVRSTRSRAGCARRECRVGTSAFPRTTAFPWTTACSAVS